MSKRFSFSLFSGLPTQFIATLGGHGYLHVTAVREGQHSGKQTGETSEDLNHPRAGSTQSQSQLINNYNPPHTSSP